MLRLTFNWVSKISLIVFIIQILFTNVSWAEEESNENVVFKDLRVEAAVRQALEKEYDSFSREELDSITSLVVKSPGELSELSLMPNIVSLDIYENEKIQDFSEIKKLKNLNRLCLKDSKVNSVDALVDSAKELPLERFGLDNCNIDNIAPLKSLQNLIHLDLSVNKVSDIGPIGELKKLILLELGGNEISDLSPISKLNNLVSLNLSTNLISNISPLQGLNKLKELNLNYNLISDFSPLSDYKKFVNLHYTGNLKTPTFYDPNLIKVYVNRRELDLDVQPVIINGRVMIPFRALCENLGVKIEWYPQTTEILASDSVSTVRLKINSDLAQVNNVPQKLDSPAVVVNGRTLVPVRFLSESFKASVDWDPYMKTVKVYHINSDAVETLGSNFNNFNEKINAYLNSSKVVSLNNYPFEYYQNPDYTPKSAKSGLLLEFKSIIHGFNFLADDWFARYELEKSNYEVSDYPYHLSNSVNVPSEIPKNLAGFTLINAIKSNENILLLYGKDYSNTNYLVSVNKKTAGINYIIDLSNMASAKPAKSYNEGYVQQSIRWAIEDNNVLYISRSHSTYASYSKGKNAYITAIDLKTMDILWSSLPLMCNSTNFVIAGDNIISGYGFSSEADFMYVLDKYTGKVAQRVYIEAAPGLLAVKNNLLYVSGYDKEYIFKINKVNRQ